MVAHRTRRGKGEKLADSRGLVAGYAVEGTAAADERVAVDRLDPPAREGIHRLLLELKARGTAILLATHDLEQAAELADRVGVLVRGRLAAEGSVPALVAEWFPAGAKDLSLTLGAAPQASASLVLDEAGLTPDPARMFWTGPFRGGVEGLPGLLASLAAAGAPVSDARIREPGLRGVFFRVAGEEIVG